MLQLFIHLLLQFIHFLPLFIDPRKIRETYELNSPNTEADCTIHAQCIEYQDTPEDGSGLL